MEFLFLSKIYDFMTNWRPPSLSELSLIIFTLELTHLGSEVSYSYLDFVFHSFKSILILNSSKKKKKWIKNLNLIKI